MRRHDRTRFDPVALCLVRKGRWGADLEAEGVPIVDFAKRPGLDMGLLLRLASFLRRSRVEIVHTHAFTAATWGRLAAALAGTPLVVAHEHSAFSLGSWPHRSVDRLLAPLTDRWLAVSESLGRDLARVERLPLSRLVVVRNGIPLTPVDAIDPVAVRRDLALPPDAELVGTVGRLESRKGLEVLLEAVKRLAAERPALRALLVGDGPLRSDLERECRRLSIADRVVFAGRREDIGRVLVALDVFVLPSHTEGLSIALLEAAAAGRPIVATDVGGNGEVLSDGRSGLLVAPGDAATLAGAIAGLLSAPDRARALGVEAARGVRARFSSALMVRSIESVYDDLLAPPGSVRRRFKTPPGPSPVRRRLRRLAARLSGAVAAASPAPALRILTYHRVNDRHPGDRMTVHPFAFREQMELLAASGRPVLRLAEALGRLRGLGPPLPRGAVAITFDDGYRDNLECAAPVLARLGLPATVFLVTERMGAEAAIDRYAGCCDHDQAMDWSEAGEISGLGFDLGGHGRTHRELAPLDQETLVDEIAGCRAEMTARLGSAPELFCYPRGSESPAVREVVSASGFAGAVTVYPGGNDPATDPFLLKRTEISGLDDLSDFRLKLAGAFDALHSLWQRARPRGA